MNDERQLFIGYDFGTGAGEAALLGDRNFHEANVIVWSPKTLSQELARFGKSISLQTYESLVRRIGALAKWVEQGHTLVLIGANTVSIRYVDAERMPRNTSLEAIAPFSGVKFVAASGSRVELCGPPNLRDAFDNVIPRICYECLLRSDDLVPLLRVAATTTGTNQIVGGYRTHGLGFIFYIPPFKGTGIESQLLINELLSLPKLLRAAPSALPAWATTYQSAPEKNTAKRIEELEKSVAELQLSIAYEKENLLAHETLKHLFCSSGATFAATVASALSELSFNVLEGPHPRADLLSKNRNQFIAIEAKGLEGPVKEASLRQVERWSAEVNSAVEVPAEDVNRDPDLRRYAEQLKKLGLPFTDVAEKCKPLIVIGTFRATPLADRKEPDFPDPVLRALGRSEACAMTGLQLFTLVMQVRCNPKLKEQIVDEIMSTRGVLARGLNWNEYMERSSD